jgi:hypothetical protein
MHFCEVGRSWSDTGSDAHECAFCFSSIVLLSDFSISCMFFFPSDCLAFFSEPTLLRFVHRLVFNAGVLRGDYGKRLFRLLSRLFLGKVLRCAEVSIMWD